MLHSFFAAVVLSRLSSAKQSRFIGSRLSIHINYVAEQCQLSFAYIFAYWDYGYNANSLVHLFINVLIVCSLFTSVVPKFRVLRKPLSWKASSALSSVPVNCSVSRPYASLDMTAALKTCSFHLSEHLVCVQNVSGDLKLFNAAASKRTNKQANKQNCW